MTHEEIVKKILSSKKYKAIYPKTVERIVGEAIEKYGIKNAELKARNTLHQIWGAFYPARPNFDKLLQNIQTESTNEALVKLLRLHSSTNERLDFLEEFYNKIFEITGKPGSILDLACGLNPLAIPWMCLNAGTQYFAFDIDVEEIDFLRKVFELYPIHNNIQLDAGDIFIDNFPKTDITFLFKFIPIIDQQSKNNIEEIIKKIKSDWIVISFPTKSIGGKNVGMGEFYSKEFEAIIEKEKWQSHKIEFENELVYIISTKM